MFDWHVWFCCCIFCGQCYLFEVFYAWKTKKLFAHRSIFWNCEGVLVSHVLLRWLLGDTFDCFSLSCFWKLKDSLWTKKKMQPDKCQGASLFFLKRYVLLRVGAYQKDDRWTIFFWGRPFFSLFVCALQKRRFQGGPKWRVPVSCYIRMRILAIG